MSDRRLPDDEVDRLLREALADDLPKQLEQELRRRAREAWRRARAEPPRARWPEWLSFPAVWRPLLPQPALLAAALAMLGAGAVMQAAPAPPGAVAPLRSLQASALTSRALARARAMECTVEVADGRRPVRSYRVDWQAPSAVRVRFDGPRGPVERALSVPETRSSVLARTTPTREEAPRDADLEPVRSYLSPSALGDRLATPGLTVTIDAPTQLPLRVEGTDPEGRRHAATCRWP